MAGCHVHSTSHPCRVEHDQPDPENDGGRRQSPDSLCRAELKHSRGPAASAVPRTTSGCLRARLTCWRLSRSLRRWCRRVNAETVPAGWLRCGNTRLRETSTPVWQMQSFIGLALRGGVSHQNCVAKKTQTVRAATGNVSERQQDASVCLRRIVGLTDSLNSQPRLFSRNRSPGQGVIHLSGVPRELTAGKPKGGKPQATPDNQPQVSPTGGPQTRSQVSFLSQSS